MLAAVSVGGRTRLWDVATSTTLRVFADLYSFELATSSVAWSPDGAMLCKGSWLKGHGVVRNVATGATVHVLKGKTKRVDFVAWSCEGVVATGSKDGTLHLWEASTGAPGHVLQGHDACYSLEFSPDVSVLASCG